MVTNFRVVCSDTGTGEEFKFDAAADGEIDAAAVVYAIRYALAASADAEIDWVPDMCVEAWVALAGGRIFAFIFRSDEPYFGEVLATGHVYLDFI